MVGSKERKPIRLSAPLSAAAKAGGGEAKSSDSRPVWVAGVVGQGQAVVAKVGVSFSFRLSLSLPLVQAADVLVGGTTARVSLVQPIA